MTLASWLGKLTVACALVGLVGCGGEKANDADAGAASAAPPKPVLGGKLGAAVAAAEASSRAAAGGPAGAASGQAGPPENGIFAPGRADAEVPRKSPPKLELVAEGKEPRTQLAYASPGEEKAGLSLSIRLGPQSGIPTMDLDLALKPDKGDKDKDKKPKKDGDKPKEDKPKEAQSGGGTPLVLKVTGAAMAKDQPGNIPKEAADAIAKLKGSELHFAIDDLGQIGGFSAVLAKEALPEFEIVLRTLGDTIATVVAPLPKKPVGVGASWMVSDRSNALGIEVVRYRVFKVDKLEGGKATLSIDVRQYAAAAETDLMGKGKIVIDLFESQGKGTAELAGAIPWPRDLQERLQARVGKDPAKPQQFFFQFIVKGR